MVRAVAKGPWEYAIFPQVITLAGDIQLILTLITIEKPGIELAMPNETTGRAAAEVRSTVFFL